MTDTTPAGTTFDVGRAGAMLAALLEQTGPALVLRDPSGRTAPVRPETAGAADGLLPVFLVAADAVWREATGNGFGLDVRPDPEALLGHRVHGARAAPFSAVMLCVLEAMDRAAGPDGLLVNDLARVAREAMPEPVPVLSVEAAAVPSPARGS